MKPSIFFAAGLFILLLNAQNFGFVVEKTYIKFSEDSIYDYVDVPPDFPGGADMLNTFISLNLVYPYKAIEKKIEGKVIVEFVVHADGSLSDFKVIKGIGFGCDEEALRVLQMMPPWEPAECEGQKVATKVVYPVIFKLSE